MYANRIMRYLRDDIASRGGTGRRLSRIQLEALPETIADPIAEQFSQSVRFLVATGLAFLDEPGFNFVYLVPTIGKYGRNN